MLLTYQRVSTLEQAADDKSSLENQERIARGFAMTQGFSQFEVSTYVDKGVSASIPLRNRPEGGRLLADAKSGDIIFASKLDRLFRSANDALNMAEIFKEKKIKLVLFDLGSAPCNESGISEFFFTVIAAVAQLERSMIRERLRNGKMAKKEKQGHIAGLAPFGYKVVGKGRTAFLEPEESEQRVITRTRELMQEHPNLSYQGMADLLNAEGITSRSGKPLFKMQAKRLITRIAKENEPAGASLS